MKKSMLHPRQTGFLLSKLWLALRKEQTIMSCEKPTDLTQTGKYAARETKTGKPSLSFCPVVCMTDKQGDKNWRLLKRIRSVAKSTDWSWATWHPLHKDAVEIWLTSEAVNLREEDRVSDEGGAGEDVGGKYLKGVTMVQWVMLDHSSPGPSRFCMCVQRFWACVYVCVSGETLMDPEQLTCSPEVNWCDGSWVKNVMLMLKVIYSRRAESDYHVFSEPTRNTLEIWRSLSFILFCSCFWIVCLAPFHRSVPTGHANMLDSIILKQLHLNGMWAWLIISSSSGFLVWLYLLRWRSRSVQCRCFTVCGAQPLKRLISFYLPSRWKNKTKT